MNVRNIIFRFRRLRQSVAVKELLSVKAKKARKAKLQPQQNGQPTNQLMRKTVSVPTNMSNVSNDLISLNNTDPHCAARIT